MIGGSPISPLQSMEVSAAKVSKDWQPCAWKLPIHGSFRGAVARRLTGEGMET